MPLSRSLRQSILNHLFGKDTWVAPSIYIGLSSTTPTATGDNVTEPSGGSYARVLSPEADWGSASAAEPSVMANTGTITFPQASADWLGAAPLTHAVFYDSASGGTFLGFGALAQAKPIYGGDTASFAPGDITVSLA